MPRGRPKRVAEPQVVEAQVSTTEKTEEAVERPSPENRRHGRVKRVPINGYRDKLVVHGQEAGWHYCWVCDYNVPVYQDGAYEFVTHAVTVGHKRINNGSQIGSKVSIPGGNGVTLFLMRCLEEDYREELHAMDQEVDEIEAAMKIQLNSKSDGRYGSVKVEEVYNGRKPVSQR